MEEHLATVNDNPSKFVDALADTALWSAESARQTAVEMLEVSTWAEINEALLRGMSIAEILTKYFLHQEALGNPPQNQKTSVISAKSSSTSYSLTPPSNAS
ncbi:hypothetical protein NHF46_11745 [Arthrobacter alpinus]|nr:hypothetical protein [Arthrobacter alpinus]